MSKTITRVRDQFPILQRSINGHPLHYLDNAATTFCPDTVLDKVYEFETGYRANVARGVHRLAAEATDAYESARASVARYINAFDPSEVVFTSGTTAAVNQLAYSLGESIAAGDEILVSMIEHHSNFVPWQMLCKRKGAKLQLIPVDENGVLDLSNLSSLINERTRIVAVTQASNVTGEMPDLGLLAQAAHQVEAKLVVDGAQAVPHGPVDVQALGADFYVFSGHKCYAPTGVGVLWGKGALLSELPEFMYGGGMVERVTPAGTRFLETNQRLEAGTPPIAQAIGLGEAVEWLMMLPWVDIKTHEAKLLGRLANELPSIAGLRVLGPALEGARLPIVSFDIEDCHPHDICHLLDQRAVALRGGHHCAQPLMDALDVMATTRASFAVFNTDADVDALLEGLHEAVDFLR